MIKKLEKFKSNDVAVLKLSNGILVIGRVTDGRYAESGSPTLCLEKVREVNFRPVQANPNSAPQMQIDINMPYVMLDQDCEVYIRYADIQAVIDCPNDIEKGYLQAISGIALK